MTPGRTRVVASLPLLNGSSLIGSLARRSLGVSLPRLGQPGTQRTPSRILRLLAIGFLVGGVLVSADAFADSQDIPAQVCEYAGLPGGQTPNYDWEGVRNDSATAVANVVCPVILYAATGRTLFIGGTDQNSSSDFSCTAHGWDINLTPVSMPTIAISTGRYTNGTIGAFTIPDSVAKLTISCAIPKAQTFVSWIGDFFIVN